MTGPRTITARSRARPGSAATFRFRTIEFVSRPDVRETCEEAIDALIAHADHGEDGTRFIASFRDTGDSSRYLITAVFVDEHAERVHDGSPAGQRLREIIRSAAVDGLRIRRWEADAGI